MPEARDRHDRPQADPAALVEHAVAACLPTGRAAAARLLDPLAAAAAADATAVGDALGHVLVDAVSRCWQRGWQPADLPRAAGRLRGPRHARMVARAVVHAAGRQRGALPARWQAHVDALDVSPRRGDGHWALAGTRSGSAVLVPVEAIALLRQLPRLPLVGPQPGDREGPSGAPRSAADARTIAKVAALLAKAESTDFPGEADALTAKAQQLMARHAIDRAMLDAHEPHGGGGRVEGRRIGIDDPYAGAKAMLVDAVASANRCRSVWSKGFGFATVFGHDRDLDAVEVLFTSLLVQSARALVAETRPAARGGRSSAATRSFRQSFLVAFASRIGVRLREATDGAAAAAARREPTVLPVLHARRDAADAACRAAFPEVRATSMSANDGLGWQAGRRAADRAQLDARPSVPDDRAPRPLAR